MRVFVVDVLNAVIRQGHVHAEACAIYLGSTDLYQGI